MSLSFKADNLNPSRYIIVPWNETDRLIIKIHRNAASGTAVITRVDENDRPMALPDGFLFRSNDGQRTDQPTLGVLSFTWAEGGILMYREDLKIIQFWNQKQASYKMYNGLDIDMQFPPNQPAQPPTQPTQPSTQPTQPSTQPAQPMEQDNTII
jgi:hypothetical protein